MRAPADAAGVVTAAATATAAGTPPATPCRAITACLIARLRRRLLLACQRMRAAGDNAITMTKRWDAALSASASVAGLHAGLPAGAEHQWVRPATQQQLLAE